MSSRKAAAGSSHYSHRAIYAVRDFSAEGDIRSPLPETGPWDILWELEGQAVNAKAHRRGEPPSAPGRLAFQLGWASGGIILRSFDAPGRTRLSAIPAPFITLPIRRSGCDPAFTGVNSLSCNSKGAYFLNTSFQYRGARPPLARIVESVVSLLPTVSARRQVFSVSPSATALENGVLHGPKPAPESSS